MSLNLILRLFVMKKKLDDQGCKGSPDMIIEIISRSTARRDKIEKFNVYEKAGIQEYWIVEPAEKIFYTTI